MMQAKPLITRGWIRAFLFVVSFLALYILVTSVMNRLVGSVQAGKQQPGETGGPFPFLQLSISFLLSILTVYFFRRVVDKQTFVSLGLETRNALSHAATGFFLGVFLLGVGSFILIANKNLSWLNIIFEPAQLFIGFVGMFIVAFAEELVFRGYILNNLLQSMNKWLALCISALVFAIFHRNNPGASPLALLNVFLAGILLGINYIYTKNLWFSILFHFSWNFYQGSILGYKVSGIHLQSLLEQHLNGNVLLTGGTFGFEGSIINAVLSIAALSSLAWVYEKKAGNY